MNLPPSLETSESTAFSLLDAALCSLAAPGVRTPQPRQHLPLSAPLWTLTIQCWTFRRVWGLLRRLFTEEQSCHPPAPPAVGLSAAELGFRGPVRSQDWEVIPLPFYIPPSFLSVLASVILPECESAPVKFASLEPFPWPWVGIRTKPGGAKLIRRTSAARASERRTVPGRIIFPMRPT